ncbi:MAG: replication initiation protein [Campylobacterales bacterium]|nr:replication initiation protein [Campylobacterales bacterium]HES60042.1 hypothetical protein [Caldithrix sp.]
MTVLKKEFTDHQDRLEELLIKNLPAKIKGGSEKHTANIFKHTTKSALQKCDFIHFNSDERISFMMFDIDKVEEKTAKEAYPTIGDFWNVLMDKIGVEPTFITETNKGYHFAYHLKNHIFTSQEKTMTYLKDIKTAINELVGCDINASNRNIGIWRNPLRHRHYFSDSFNYELKDFRSLIVPKKTVQQKFKRDITIRQLDRSLLTQGNRNIGIFYASMRWAKNKKNLSANNIYHYALSVNQQCDIPLGREEIEAIAKSIYNNYYTKNLILVSSSEPIKKRDINEGIMNFEKMGGLSKDEYKNEVKRRQMLSAQRTNEVVDIEQKKESMREVQKAYSQEQKNINQAKVNDAIETLRSEGKKITVSAISRLCGLSRNTVRKYYQA